MLKSAMERGLSDRFSADTNSSTHCPYRCLCAAAMGDGSRAWVGRLLGHLGLQVDDLLGRLGSYLFGAYLVPGKPVDRPANPSMGLGPANSTSPASFHTAIGDSADISGIVLGQSDELSIFYRLRKLVESGACDQPGARST
jgi:hypothetical protein